ncbi:MAG: LolA family protein [Alphaproteobacteria bacterium]
MIMHRHLIPAIRRHTLLPLILAVAMGLGLAVGPATAQTTAQTTIGTVVLGEADQSDVARIEDYLNRIGTLQSRFVQFTATGAAEGLIYMSRPGDMRIEYDPPTPVLMVASGRLLMYHDSALKQTSFLPVDRTPAAFFLRETVDLNDGLTITDFRRGPGSLRLTLVESNNPEAGSISLVFEDRPLRLAKWQIVDAQGQRVEVVLLDPQFGVDLDNSLFDLVDPNIRARDN